MNRNLSHVRRAILLLVCGGAARLLDADMVSFSQDFRLNPTAPGTALAFTAFNPSLGTLTGVEVAFSATRRHEFGLWNIDGGNTPHAINYAASLTGSTLNLNGALLHFADAIYGPVTTAPLASVSDDDFAADFAAGYARFLAGNPANFVLGANGINLATISFSGLLPLSFDGQLVFDYNSGVAAMLGYNAGTWSVLGADNAQAASLVDIYGQAQVTYYYAAQGVPDHVSGWWLVAVLSGVGFVHGCGRRQGAVSRL